MRLKTSSVQEKVLTGIQVLQKHGGLGTYMQTVMAGALFWRCPLPPPPPPTFQVLPQPILLLS